MNEILENEIESIKSIYDYLSWQCEGDKLKMNLKPYPAGPEENASLNVVGITLTFSNLENYPLDRPTVELSNGINIDGSRQRDIEILIDEILTSHAGFEVLFDLYTEITAYLQANNCPIRSIFDKMSGVTGPVPIEQIEIGYVSDSDLSDTSRSEEVIDPNAGKLADKDVVPPDYRVTEEQFKEWTAKFREEMISKGVWRDVHDVDARPTGKQIFLKGLDKDLIAT